MLATDVETLAGLDNAQVTERLRQLELALRRTEAEVAATISESQREGFMPMTVTTR